VNKAIDKKGITWFLVLTFIPTIAVAIVLNQLGVNVAEQMFFYVSMVMMSAMFFPAIAAFVVRKFITKEGFKDSYLRFGSFKPYLKSAIVIPLLFAIVYLITSFFYAPDFTLQTFIQQNSLPELHIQPSIFILLIFVSTFLTSPLINFIPSFGEEFGWRGYLLPKLLPLGKRKALIYSSIIWGLWHAPFVLLIGFGKYGVNSILGVLLFTSIITLLGIYIGEKTLKHKSVYLASFMHGVFNAQAYGIWVIIFPVLNPFIGGIGGIIGLLVLFPLAMNSLGLFEGFHSLKNSNK
jgi:membrane protease YdiL (CAAX protease family)